MINNNIPFTATSSSTYSNGRYYYCTHPINQMPSYDYWATRKSGDNALGEWWQIVFDSPVNINYITVGSGSGPGYVTNLTSYGFDVTLDDKRMVARGFRMGSAADPARITFTRKVVHRNGRYYYRKASYAFDLPIAVSKETSANGYEIYSYTNSTNNKQVITFSKLDVACNANSNHGILDIKVGGEIIKSIENIPSHSGSPTITSYSSGAYSSALPLDPITLMPGQILQFWGRWAGSHSGVTWVLVGEPSTS